MYYHNHTKTRRIGTSNTYYTTHRIVNHVLLRRTRGGRHLRERGRGLYDVFRSGILSGNISGKLGKLFPIHPRLQGSNGSGILFGGKLAGVQKVLSVGKRRSVVLLPPAQSHGLTTDRRNCSFGLSQKSSFTFILMVPFHRKNSGSISSRTHT